MLISIRRPINSLRENEKLRRELIAFASAFTSADDSQRAISVAVV